jgi:hypothetical protein
MGRNNNASVRARLTEGTGTQYPFAQAVVNGVIVISKSALRSDVQTEYVYYSFGQS